MTWPIPPYILAFRTQSAWDRNTPESGFYKVIAASLNDGYLVRAGRYVAKCSKPAKHQYIRIERLRNIRPRSPPSRKRDCLRCLRTLQSYIDLLRRRGISLIPRPTGDRVSKT